MWGWLAFNCGSTFGISNGKWKLAAKAAVTTLNASMGGGLSGIFITFLLNKGKFEVNDIINSILAGLVSVTAGCSVVRPWEAVLIGFIGGLLVVPSVPLLDRLRIDDPVGAFPVHGLGGFWGMVACGIFVDQDPLDDMSNGQVGLLHGGGFRLLGIQLFTCLCIACWSALITFLSLGLLKVTMGIRMTIEEELIGADLFEHNIGTLDRLCLMEEQRYFASRVRPRRLSGLMLKAIKKRGICGCSPDEESNAAGLGGGANDSAHSVNEMLNGAAAAPSATVNGGPDKLMQLHAYHLYGGLTFISGGTGALVNGSFDNSNDEEARV